jgi:protein-tyrosine phosphatase
MTDTQLFPHQNGQITIKLGWKYGWQTAVFHGGPFKYFKTGDNRVGVCLLEHQPPNWDVIALPIKDFGVPRDDQTQNVEEAILQAYAAAFDGKDVYVGCTGGIGRTGTFISLLVKATLEDSALDPVALVRGQYLSYAVETDEQHEYVEDFDVAAVRRQVMHAGWDFFFRKLLRKVGLKV